MISNIDHIETMHHGGGFRLLMLLKAPRKIVDCVCAPRKIDAFEGAHTQSTTHPSTHY
jgi:hypothetical protein